MTARIVFLCSGGGGNLRFIYEAAIQGWLGDAKVCGVITDRECGASKFATQKNIEHSVVDYSLSRQSALLDRIGMLDPDIVVTTVHRIVSDEIVCALQGRLINLHYSLLPAFGGLIGSMPVRKAMEYGVKFIGTTLHFVSESVDSGVPIVQSVTPIYPSDTVENIMDCQFQCGSVCLFTGIINLIEPQTEKYPRVGMLELNKRSSFFNPAASVPSHVTMESFWSGIKNW